LALAVPVSDILFGVTMQSEKRYYSSVTNAFDSNARHIVSYRTGSLLSIVIGLVFCFFVFLFIKHYNPLAKNASGKQSNSRFEKTEVNGAVPFNDKIAVAGS